MVGWVPVPSPCDLLNTARSGQMSAEALRGLDLTLRDKVGVPGMGNRVWGSSLGES